jgi:hypothetical protein
MKCNAALPHTRVASEPNSGAAFRLIRQILHLTINSIKYVAETNYVGRRLCAQGRVTDRGLSVLYGTLVLLTKALARKIILGFHSIEVCARVVGNTGAALKGTYQQHS